MNEPAAPLCRDDEPDPERRLILAGLAVASASTLLPALTAQPATAQPAQDAFVALSKLLTGRPSIDRQHGARLYEALSADNPRLAENIEALLAWIHQRKVGPDQLQAALDAESSPLAALPRAIATAWYTGIVGENERARTIAFETALMHVVVADRLNPPSYCYGPPGSWTAEPGARGAHG